MSGCANRSAWDDSRRMDRGKVMTAADLDAGKKFGRYLDVDDDGITYRTYPARIRRRAHSSPAARRRTGWRDIRKKAPIIRRTWTGC